MAMPPVLVGVIFLAAVGGALGLMAYLAWKGSKPSSFFTEAVGVLYDLELSEAEIDAYYELKDLLLEKYAPDVAAIAAEQEATGEAAKPVERWTTKVPQEERANLQKALLLRLVNCIGKLDQVQRDKPGNWKLWQSKLVSERYWGSLVDAEKVVSQEIDSCIAEAEEITHGWGAHIFGQGVQCYRKQKQFEFEKQAKVNQLVDEKKAKEKQVQEEKQAVVKAVVDEKKQKEREEKRKEIEKRVEEERKLMEERSAQKAMEKLLAAEEAAASKKGGKSSAAQAKPKAKKK